MFEHYTAAEVPEADDVTAHLLNYDRGEIDTVSQCVLREAH